MFLKAILPLLLLVSAPAPTQTLVISQEFEFTNLDVMYGTYRFHVDPFPNSEGWLLDVRVVVEHYETDHTVWLTNESSNFYPTNYTSGLDCPATGIGLVPWIHDTEGNIWSMISFGGIFWPCSGKGAVWYVIPPHSEHLVRSGCNTGPDWQEQGFSLLYHSSKPHAFYWYDISHPDGINLTFRPTWSHSICVVPADGSPDQPWPGTATVREFEFGLRYRIEYEYEPW